MKKLRILFDARPMVDNKKSGVGYYITNLVENLVQEYPDKLRLEGFYFNFLGRNKDNLKCNSFNSLSFVPTKIIPGKTISLLRKIKCRPYLEYFIKNKADILLYTNFVSLPSIRKIPNAIIIYDMG